MVGGAVLEFELPLHALLDIPLRDLGGYAHGIRFIRSPL